MAIAISKVKRRKLYDLHHEHTYLSFQQEIVAAMYEKYGVSQADSRAPHQHNLQFCPAELVDAGAMLYMGTAPYKPITTITGVPHAMLSCKGRLIHRECSSRHTDPVLYISRVKL
jgi:hypothetical protein